MAKREKVTLRTLEKYAGLLGRNSLARLAYDRAMVAKADKRKLEIYRTTTGFNVVVDGNPMQFG